MALQGRDGDQPATVETYRPSQYTEAVWQVVSDAQQTDSFVPAEFKQVGDAAYPVDAMFADFGNTSGTTIELSREAGDFDLQQVQDLEHDDGGSEVEETLSSSGAIAGEPAHSSGDNDAIEATEEPKDGQDSGDESSVELDVEGQTEDGGSEHQVHETTAQGDDRAQQFNEDKVREALQQAYEQGAADTRQEVLEIQRQLEERYRLLWEDMQVQLEEALHANEAKAVELALQVAKRLVGDVVDTKRDYIIRVVQEAIKLTAGAQISSVRVGPQDYEFLKLEGYGDKTKALAGEYLSFVSDDSIRAGCVLVTSAGEVDFDLGKAWERIRAKVLQEPES